MNFNKFRLASSAMARLPSVRYAILKHTQNYYSILGLYWDNGEKMATTIVYWGYMGIMLKKMETTIVYWGYMGNNGKENGNYYSILGVIGIMEKKMETTIA